MENQTSISGKEPWLAVILSTIFPGIGQIYAGKIFRGLIFFVVTLSVASLASWSIFSPTGDTWLGFQLLIGVLLLLIFNLFDAHRCTRRGNDVEFERLRKGGKDPWLAVFLSTIVPGLGQAYQGQWLFAVLFFVVVIGTSNFTEKFPLVYPLEIALSYLCLYHAYTYSPTHREKFQRLILGICLILLISELLSLFLTFSVRTFVVEARYMPSGSMIPTLQVNDRLTIDKLAYRSASPQRGDIVLFNPTASLKEQNFNDAFLKRIVGLPGDNLEVKAGKVYINGKPLQEDYIAESPQYQYEPTQVPPNSYFVLGDNRNNSYDSHYWGFLPADLIIGKATKIFWPPERMGRLK